MNVLPDGWCPGLPPAERLARLLLDQRHPDLLCHLVDPDEVRYALARRWPGHLLQDVIVDRERLFEETTVLAQTVIGYVIEVTGLAQMEAALRALEVTRP